MAEEDSAKEIRPVNGSVPPSVERSQSWPVSARVMRQIARAFSVAALLGLAGWLFQNFLTLRAIVDVVVSRVDLAVCCIALFAAAWVLTTDVNRRILRRVVIGIMLLSVGFSIDWWAPKPEVIVSPRAVRFRGSHLENFPFAVKNKIDDYVYGVQLVVKLQRDSPLAAYMFDVPMSTRKPIIEGSKFADITGVQCADLEGRPVAIFWIYRLAPGEVREFSVTHKIDSATKADAYIGGFNKTPLPRMDDIAQFVGSFRATEPMTCNGAYSYGLDPNMPPRRFTVTVQKAK